MVGYITGRFTWPWAVTHPSSNRAQCRLTTCGWTIIADGRTNAKVQHLGCYADRESDPDLPLGGPDEADPQFCMVNFCHPKVSARCSCWLSVNVNRSTSANYRVATRLVFAGTSRFSACLSRVPVERLPGRYMSRFLSILHSVIDILPSSQNTVIIV